MNNKQLDWAVQTCIFAKGYMHPRGVKIWQGIAIECIEDKLTFDSLQSCAAYYKVSTAAIKYSIRGERVVYKINKTFRLK